jgi:PAS domain S-box-containing protein
MMADMSEEFRKAGYFEFTTVKRAYGVKALNAVLDYFDSSMSSGDSLTSGYSYDSPLYAEILDTARKHSSRGITLDMFLGAFKIIINRIEEELLVLDTDEYMPKTELFLLFRKKTDILEHAIVFSWVSASNRNMNTALMESNRKLSIAKCRYEKIVEASDSITLFFGENGIITDSNFKAKKVFGEDPAGYDIIGFLGINEKDIDSFLQKYLGARHEVFMDGQYFSVRLIPLGNAGIGLTEYMFVFHNITGMMEERQFLEEEVHKRVGELDGSKKFFESVFSSAGDGIIIFDSDNKLVKVNRKACSMFGIKEEKNGKSCLETAGELFAAGNQKILFSVAKQLRNMDTWDGEIEMTGLHGKFPALVTLNRFDIDDKVYFSFLVRDISPLKRMENDLIEEKKHVEEKNITLKNIIESIRDQEEGLRSEIIFKMESQILPLIERLRKEADENERGMVYADLCETVSCLFDKDCGKSHTSEIYSRLSRTEERICKMIVTGYTTKQIAEELFVTSDTVQTHRKNIRKKLEISNKDVNLYTYLKNLSTITDQ